MATVTVLHKLPPEYVETMCLALPTGETLWWDIDESGEEYIREVLSKWKGEHPEFKDTPCSLGAVRIVMLRDAYIKIGASMGPGEFVFP